MGLNLETATALTGLTSEARPTISTEEVLNSIESGAKETGGVTFIDRNCVSFEVEGKRFLTDPALFGFRPDNQNFQINGSRSYRQVWWDRYKADNKMNGAREVDTRKLQEYLASRKGLSAIDDPDKFIDEVASRTDYVLISHLDHDHFDLQVLYNLWEQNPNLKIILPHGSKELINKRMQQNNIEHNMFFGSLPDDFAEALIEPTIDGRYQLANNSPEIAAYETPHLAEPAHAKAGHIVSGYNVKSEQGLSTFVVGDAANSPELLGTIDTLKPERMILSAGTFTNNLYKVFYETGANAARNIAEEGISHSAYLLPAAMIMAAKLDDENNIQLPTIIADYSSFSEIPDENANNRFNPVSAKGIEENLQNIAAGNLPNALEPSSKANRLLKGMALNTLRALYGKSIGFSQSEVNPIRDLGDEALKKFMELKDELEQLVQKTFEQGGFPPIVMDAERFKVEGWTDYTDSLRGMLMPLAGGLIARTKFANEIIKLIEKHGIHEQFYNNSVILPKPLV